MAQPAWEWLSERRHLLHLHVTDNCQLSIQNSIKALYKSFAEGILYELRNKLRDGSRSFHQWGHGVQPCADVIALLCRRRRRANQFWSAAPYHGVTENPDWGTIIANAMLFQN